MRDDPRRTTLPLIIPVLIHHSATGWTAATSFEDILAVPLAARPSLLRHAPRFEMKVVDVSHDPTGGLVRELLTALGRVVLFCLSVAGDDRRLVTGIDQLVAELNALQAAPGDVDALVALMQVP